MNLHDITPPLPLNLDPGIHVRVREDATDFIEEVHGRTARILRRDGSAWRIQWDEPLDGIYETICYEHEVDIIP